MKFIYVLMVMMVMAVVSCTSMDQKSEQKAEIAKPIFMSSIDIANEFKQIAPIKGEADEGYSQDEIKRLDYLIPDEVFFDDTEKKDLQNAKILKSFQMSYKPKGAIDLRQYASSVKSQDDGKCSAYAGIGAIENMLQHYKGLKNVDLAEWHIWSKYRQYSCSAFIKSAVKYKIADEKYYPQYKGPKTGLSKNAHAWITKQTYLGDNLDRAIEALDKGHVVYLGMKTPKDVVKCKSVISPYTPASSGGHAMLIEGYKLDPNVKGGVYFITKNSWGSDCGDKGYHYIPLKSLCTRSDYYCILWDIGGVESSQKPSDTPDIPVKPVGKWQCSKYKRLWYTFWVKRKCTKWVWVEKK